MPVDLLGLENCRTYVARHAQISAKFAKGAGAGYASPAERSRSGLESSLLHRLLSGILIRRGPLAVVRPGINAVDRPPWIWQGQADSSCKRTLHALLQ